MINKALAKIIFLSISISFHVNAATVDLTQSLWIIDGFDTSNWNGSKLSFTKQVDDGDKDLLEGYFDWISNDDFRGRELFTGTLSDELALHIEGFELVNPIQIQLSIYDAEVSPDGKSIINGTWLGISGTPSGVWSATVVPLPAAFPLMLSGIALLGLSSRVRKNLMA